MMLFGLIGNRSCITTLLVLCFAVLAPICSSGTEIEMKNTIINLRKGPSTQSEILKQLPPRSRLIVLERRENWYKVRYCSHLQGYVHRNLVAVQEPARESGTGTDLVFQQATIAFARRDWPEVVRIFSETPGLPGLNAGEGYMLGIAYRELGKHEKAEAALVHALGRPERNWDMTSAEIYRQLLALRQKKKRWNEVVETANRITAQLPTDPWAVKARAEALLHLRKPAEAFAEYQSVLINNPADAEALVGMGRAKIGLNDMSGAEGYFTSAIRKAPTNEQSYIGLAELQIALKQPAKAEATLRRGVGAVQTSALLKERLRSVEKARQGAEQRAVLLQRRENLTAQLCAGGISSYRFAIVSQVRPKLYEVRLDTDEVAFLQTNRSVFSGPGSHEIPLMNTGEIPLRLAPKRGGFTGKTRLLKELTDVQVMQYQQTSRELQEVNNILGTFSDKRQSQSAAVTGRLEKPAREETTDPGYRI